MNFIDPQDEVVLKIISSMKKAGLEHIAEDGKAFKTAMTLKGCIPVIYSVTDLMIPQADDLKGS